jgi:hypothetical protein
VPVPHLDIDEVYLGELNAASPAHRRWRNVTAETNADISLFLFHVFEYIDVD